MKLLFKKASAIRSLPRSEVGILAMWGVGLVLIEILGQNATGDLHDLIAALFIVAGASFTLAHHRKRPLRLIYWIQLRLSGLLRRLTGFMTEFGLDLVGQPVIPSAWPKVLSVVCLTSLGLVVAIVSVGSWFPSNLRFFAEHVSYIVHLVCLSTLWCGILVALLLTVLFPIMVLRDVLVLKRIRNGRVPEVLGYVAGGLYLAALGLIAVLVPLWWATVLFVASVTVLLTPLCLMNAPRLSLLFRNRDGNVRRVEWQRFTALQSMAVFLPLTALVLLARGSSVFGEGTSLISKSMPMTSAFGLALAWSMTGSSLVWCALSTKLLILGTRQNPARSSSTALYVLGGESSSHMPAIKQACQVEGLEVVHTLHHRDDVVIVRLDESGDCDQLVWRGGVPNVTPEQLQDPIVLSRLRRRDHIQRRRRLLRGIQTLFKHTQSRSYQYGEGFWLAPHLWFVLGMSRDSAGPSGIEADGAWIEINGPPYHRVFSRHDRHHWHQIMQTTEIGLIFVADGVRFSSLKRTLRVIFEINDMHGGRRRVEDRDLVGIPGVRCILHDLDLDTPFTNRHYPEPDYEDVARARVLHIYRDRGGEEEILGVPDLFDLEPIGAPGGVNVSR